MIARVVGAPPARQEPRLPVIVRLEGGLADLIPVFQGSSFALFARSAWQFLASPPPTKSPTFPNLCFQLSCYRPCPVVSCRRHAAPLRFGCRVPRVRYSSPRPSLQLVEKVALPLVAERLSTAYDAMSRRQTACLVSAVSEILVYDPKEESLKTLLGSARDALKVGRKTAGIHSRLAHLLPAQTNFLCTFCTGLVDPPPRPCAPLLTLLSEGGLPTSEKLTTANHAAPITPHLFVSTFPKRNRPPSKTSASR